MPFSKIIPINLTRRQITIEDLAKDYQYHYDSEKDKDVVFIENFLFFNTKHIDHIYNKISKHDDSFASFDITFSEGEFIAKEVVRTTMLYISLKRTVPVFTLDREGFLERVYAFAGFKDIPFKDHHDFSKRFYLRGEDEAAIKQLFDTELIHFFESNPYYHIESNGEALLVFSKERLASIKEIKALIDFGKRLKQVISP